MKGFAPGLALKQRSNGTRKYPICGTELIFIERFSFECRKTKTKPKTVIGFGFTLASDWLSRWREFFKPITERSKAKPISGYFRYSIENRSIIKGPAMILPQSFKSNDSLKVAIQFNGC